MQTEQTVTNLATDLYTAARVIVEKVQDDELKPVFAGVQDPKNWKLPVQRSLVFLNSSEGFRNAILLIAALIFYVGGAELELCSQNDVLAVWISSRGYYHYIGA